MTTFYLPANEADLLTTMQSALDKGLLLHFDPTTRMGISGTKRFHLSDTGGAPSGFRFNGAQFSSTINDPTKNMFEFDLPPGQSQNRQLWIDDGYFYGGGYAGLLCAAAIKITTSGGGGLFLMKMRNLISEFAGVGIHVEGNIFEFILDMPDIKDMRDAGIRFANGNGVFSNGVVRNPFLSRMPGAGLDLVTNCNSVMVSGGSFISCNGGGIVAPSGIKFLGDGADFENCGNQGHPDKAAVTVGPTLFGTTIDNISCENTAGASPGAVSYVRSALVTVQNVRLYASKNIVH